MMNPAATRNFEAMPRRSDLLERLRAGERLPPDTDWCYDDVFRDDRFFRIERPGVDHIIANGELLEGDVSACGGGALLASATGQGERWHYLARELGHFLIHPPAENSVAFKDMPAEPVVEICAALLGDPGVLAECGRELRMYHGLDIPDFVLKASSCLAALTRLCCVHRCLGLFSTARVTPDALERFRENLW